MAVTLVGGAPPRAPRAARRRKRRGRRHGDLRRGRVVSHRRRRTRSRACRRSGAVRREAPRTRTLSRLAKGPCRARRPMLDSVVTARSRCSAGTAFAPKLLVATIGKSSTRNWRTLRAQILYRDAHCCVACGHAAEDVDHVLRRRWNGCAGEPRVAVRRTVFEAQVPLARWRGAAARYAHGKPRSRPHPSARRRRHRSDVELALAVPGVPHAQVQRQHDQAGRSKSVPSAAPAWQPADRTSLCGA